MCDLDGIKTRIKKLKSEMNITIDALSEKSGVSVGTLNKFLGKETKEPSIKTVIRLAQAFNVSVDYILYGNIDEVSVISDYERELIDKLRSHPEMQPAINKMLDIQENSIAEDMINEMRSGVPKATSINTK